MRMFQAIVLWLFVLQDSKASISNYPWRAVLRSYDKIETYLIDDHASFSFNETLDWCLRLGGKLPMPSSEQDSNFLMNNVIIKDSPGGSMKSWMGRKPSHQSSCSSQWLDNRPVDYRFQEYFSENCSTCQDKDCCAMYVWNDSDHEKVGFMECSQSARKVCIVPGDLIAKIEGFLLELPQYNHEEGQAKISEKPSNSGIVWTMLITCLFLSTSIFATTYYALYHFKTNFQDFPRIRLSESPIQMRSMPFPETDRNTGDLI